MKRLNSIIHIWFILVLAFPLNSLAADTNRTGDPVRGATEWANNCSRCHHMRNPQDNRDDVWVSVVTHMRVRAGLTGMQARDILAYLQSVNFTPAITTKAKSIRSANLTGKQIYSGTCIACHGADGKGAIPGVPNLSGRLAKTDQILLQHIKDGFQSPGSTLAMPARGGNPDLTDEDIKTVLQHLRREFGK